MIRSLVNIIILTRLTSVKKMVNKPYQYNELRPFSVVFDELFDHFNNTLEYTVKQQTSYPPYNINKIDDLNYQD